jgi:hypothetical protein
MTRFVQFPQVNRAFRGTLSLLLSVVLLAACFVLANSSASAQSGFAGPQELTLQNGWVNYSSTTANASVQLQNGMVQLRGAIASGASSFAFTLPAAFIPQTDVYVPVDLCGATYGRLWIQGTSGNVYVQEQGGGWTGTAACFTSLDGASFARTASGYTALTLINGWSNGPYSTSNAAAKVIGGNVHLKGAIYTSGTNPQPFVLPAGFRPAKAAYVSVDLCGSYKGRLNIGTDGTVTIEQENGAFDEAPCFTSLDGAWFAVTNASYLPLTPLSNGWTGGPFSTHVPAAAGEFGTVYFKGAMATSGSSDEPIASLPLRFRPITTVYVAVDMCNATNGRLVISPNGTVTVQAETSFADASCFTSLDGVSFVQ